MIEGQFLARSTILAGEAVAQKQVEAGEGRMLRRLHILPERDHARDRHRVRRRMNLALVILDDRHAVEEYRLDRGLPRPQAQRVIAQRRIVGVEEIGRAPSKLQSLMRNSYAVFCLKKKTLKKLQ